MVTWVTYPKGRGTLANGQEENIAADTVPNWPWVVKSIHICRRPLAPPAGVFRFLKRLPVKAFDVSGFMEELLSNVDVAVLTPFKLESPCSIASSFFTFTGISPGSYISPRPGFKLFFRSLKERASSSGGTSAPRFKLLSLSASASAAGGVGSDEDDASTGAWGGVIICHSPATPCDRRSSSCAAIRSASGSSYPNDWAVV